MKKLSGLLHQECSNIKGNLRFRHWYAHGRYFKHKAPIPDPEDIEVVCNDITDSIINCK
ncbi:MAG: hypothetical protein GY795_06205 [Desulfobacterales bacterium]|nr:hypothetical protein [Desulfobacterales bacterium]